MEIAIVSRKSESKRRRRNGLSGEGSADQQNKNRYGAAHDYTPWGWRGNTRLATGASATMMVADFHLVAATIVAVHEIAQVNPPRQIASDRP